ncbi:hypothetical protein [Glycomyces buryatensis]|uniref:Uncharacterized protein n=1 Tax=Glycomyces buryatensis TaxID=2570927 RepID=A0A4S8Q8R6_9ACTN|nr:hypothetical protein [Glycomyces buryatensis]THV40797.1 hypothetical protein FAB82_14200 [Glycomyces buryatensis]
MIVPPWTLPPRNPAAFRAKIAALNPKPSPSPQCSDQRLNPRPNRRFGPRAMQRPDLPSLGRLREAAFDRFMEGSADLAQAHHTEMDPGRWERAWTSLREGRIWRALKTACGRDRKGTQSRAAAAEPLNRSAAQQVRAARFADALGGARRARQEHATAISDAEPEGQGRLRGSGGWLSGPGLDNVPGGTVANTGGDPDTGDEVAPDYEGLTPPTEPPEPSKTVHTAEETARNPHAPGFHTAPDGTHYLNFPLQTTARAAAIKVTDLMRAGAALGALMDRGATA